MKHLTTLTLAALASIAVLHTPPAAAAPRPLVGQVAAEVQPDQVIGKTVISRKGQQEVGRVASLFFDEAGEIEAAIIKRDGIRGLFSRELAIPWDALEFSADGQTLVTDLERSDLQTVTVFQRG